MNSKTILIIAKAESVHTSRWINQLKGSGFKIHLFSSVDYGRSHSDLNNIDIYHSFYARIENTVHSRLHGLNIEVGSYWLRRGLRRIVPNYRRHQLMQLIKELKPDLIHAMEFQSGAYLAIEAKKKMQDFPPLWVTNWGSDIFHYVKDPLHKQKIVEVLKNADYYSCECERDIKLAKQIGFQGKFMPIVPNAGGLDIIKTTKYAKTSPSKRKSIMIKGYQGWVGRALITLQAIDKLGKYIADHNYRLILYSSHGNSEVNNYARSISDRHNIPLQILPSNTSHKYMLMNHGKARISIGMSMSDGISTSMLEAMSVGSFPIQSYTSCADEWTQDGVTSFLVPPEDVAILARAIKTGLSNDKLVDQAAKLNKKTINERANQDHITEKVIKMYNQTEQNLAIIK